MNPAIMQAAAERTRDMHAYVATRRYAAEIRRARREQRSRQAANAGRGFRVLRALRAA